jgi:hypothetical protein
MAIFCLSVENISTSITLISHLSFCLSNVFVLELKFCETTHIDPLHLNKTTNKIRERTELIPLRVLVKPDERLVFSSDIATKPSRAAGSVAKFILLTSGLSLIFHDMKLENVKIGHTTRTVESR